MTPLRQERSDSSVLLVPSGSKLALPLMKIRLLIVFTAFSWSSLSPASPLQTTEKERDFIGQRSSPQKQTPLSPDDWHASCRSTVVCDNPAKDEIVAALQGMVNDSFGVPRAAIVMQPDQHAEMALFGCGVTSPLVPGTPVGA